MGGGMNKWSLHYWPQCVLAKVCANTILVVCLAKIRSVDEIAYWMTILSVSCSQMIVMRGNVANSSHTIKLGTFVKKCGLWIFVWDRQRNSGSTKICTLIPIAKRWLPLRTWKCVARRGTPSTQSPRLTSIVSEVFFVGSPLSSSWQFGHKET